MINPSVTSNGRPPCPAGITHHSAMQLATMMAAMPASQGLRRPMRSDIAPVIGARMPTTKPASVLARLQ